MKFWEPVRRNEKDLYTSSWIYIQDLLLSEKGRLKNDTSEYHLFNEKTIGSPKNTYFVCIINILYVFSIYHRRKWGR